MNNNQENYNRRKENLDLISGQDILKFGKIYIDTCVMLPNNKDIGRTSVLFHHILKSLCDKVEDRIVAICPEVFNEVSDKARRISFNEEQRLNVEYAQNAYNAINSESRIDRTGSTRIKGETFGDSNILEYVFKQFIATKILVITDDKRLTNDVLLLNTLQSVKGKEIEVWSYVKLREYLNNYSDRNVSIQGKFERTPFVRGTRVQEYYQSEGHSIIKKIKENNLKIKEIYESHKWYKDKVICNNLKTTIIAQLKKCDELQDFARADGSNWALPRDTYSRRELEDLKSKCEGCQQVSKNNQT